MKYLKQKFVLVVLVTPKTSLLDFSVRLFGGRSSLFGNLEIYREGNWRETCITNWTMSSSHLLCKTLGYSGAHSYGIADSRHGKQNRNALLNSVKCNGSEKTLNECLHQVISSLDCATGKVVEVACSGMSYEIGRASCRERV